MILWGWLKKTGTRAHAPKPPFYEAALLFPLDHYMFSEKSRRLSPKTWRERGCTKNRDEGIFKRCFRGLPSLHVLRWKRLTLLHERRVRRTVKRKSICPPPLCRSLKHSMTHAPKPPFSETAPFSGVAPANQTEESEVRELPGKESGICSGTPPFFGGVCIAFTSKRGFRNQFRTPFLEVRKPHFLRFGLPELLLTFASSRSLHIFRKLKKALAVSWTFSQRPPKLSGPKIASQSLGGFQKGVFVKGGKLGASQMTTKFLKIKFAKFPNFIVMEFPKKNSICIWGQFSVNFPLPNPLQNANFINIVVSASLRNLNNWGGCAHRLR